MRIGSKKGGAKNSLRLDNNIETYHLQRDARSAPEQRRMVRRDRIHPSPHQPRRVFPSATISELADSLDATGLIHAPLVRPHPTEEGDYELIAGEKRVRALTLLGDEGRGEGLIDRDSEGHLLVPVVVEPIDDARAHAMVLVENLQREDLSAYELAGGLAAFRDALRQQGEKATVRAVAQRIQSKSQTSVTQHLQVADSVTREVLLAAGVVASGEADYDRLAQLKLQPLVRVAQAASRSLEEAGMVLLRELARVGDKTASRELRERRRRAKVSVPTSKRYFQMNIRTPLDEVAPSQARAYVERMLPAVDILCERASEELDASGADQVAASLERIAKRLRTAHSSS